MQNACLCWPAPVKTWFGHQSRWMGPSDVLLALQLGFRLSSHSLGSFAGLAMVPYDDDPRQPRLPASGHCGPTRGCVYVTRTPRYLESFAVNATPDSDENRGRWVLVSKKAKAAGKCPKTDDYVHIAARLPLHSSEKR